MKKVLVVDDEADIRDLLKDILEDEGYCVEIASSANDALTMISAHSFDAILLDIWLEGSALDGMGILKEIKSKGENSDIPIIMISGHGTVEMAVKAIKDGAYDFIEKPFKVEKLIILLQRAIASCKANKENTQLKKDFFDGFKVIGPSKISQIIQKQMDAAFASSSRVLLIGESGVGKEFAAKMIHYNSNRKDEDFTILRPKGIDASDASLAKMKEDLIKKCGFGTLYIDEIAGLCQKTQSFLLNVMQDAAFKARVISATDKDLTDASHDELINKSLYYRLNILPIILPPIRKRTSEIEFFIQYFIKYFSQNLGVAAMQLSKDAMIFMQSYNWPGNIRQIKNVIEWLVIMKSKEKTLITVDDFPKEMFYNTSCDKSSSYEWIYDVLDMPLKEARDEFEKQYIKNQILCCDGNISKTAEKIGVDRSALHRKMKILGLEKEVV